MRHAHSVRTYLRACFGSETAPEGLADELRRTFNCPWIAGKHDFHTPVNSRYDVDVNNMLRVTLQPFFGKEAELKRIAGQYGVEFVLEVVPELQANSTEPTPILSLDKDIIAFLYLSDTIHDLDLYV